MELLLVIFGIVVVFSILTLLELWALKHLGFDVVGHLRVTKQSGKDVKFFFEAFGAVAFVVAQPILLTATTVWAFAEARPQMAAVIKSLNAAAFAIIW